MTNVAYLPHIVCPAFSVVVKICMSVRDLIQWMFKNNGVTRRCRGYSVLSYQARRLGFAIGASDTPLIAVV